MVDISIPTPTQSPDENRAVSPVIGVILMVAITVILAAVIGAFVLNLGTNIQQSAPMASITADDAGDKLTTGQDTVLYINHEQGDSIKVSNLRITIKNATSGAQIADITHTNDEWTSSSGLTVADGLGDGSFDAGDQLTITEASDELSSPVVLTVQIIDTKSGSTVATATVDVE